MWACVITICLTCRLCLWMRARTSSMSSPGARSDPADERVLRPRRVTCEDDAVNPERHDAEGVEDAHVQVCDDHLLGAQQRAKWDDGHGKQAWDHHDRGGEPVIRLAHVGRSKVLFQERFDGISNWLQKTKEADAIWAVAVLDGGRDFALHPDRVGDNEHEHREDAENLQRAEEHGLPRRGSKPIYNRLNHRLNPDRHASIAETHPC